MLVVKNKSISLLWDVNFNSCKLFENIYCFDLQHGRLLTWLKTKNIVPYALVTASSHLNYKFKLVPVNLT